MRYFEAFAGVGGFSLGIERAYAGMGNDTTRSGARLGDTSDPRTGPDDTGLGILEASCVGFSEVDKHASAVLRYHYPNVKNYGDISKIDWSEVPDFDLLVGGSPCQDFSIAGKRAGLGGERSGLFREFLRALEEKQPGHFIWENVKGTLSSRRGWDFANIQVALAEAGYGLWWQVLNAKDFGVPQNRERIFIVGTRGGRPREVFFERKADSDTLAGGGKGAKRPARTVDGQGGMNGRGTHVETVNPGVHQDYRVYRPKGVSPALASNRGGGSAKHPFVVDHGDLKKTEDRSNNIDANYWKGHDNHGARTVIREDTRIRRLTPTECELLMGWPDDWTRYGDYGEGPKEISDTQRYKMAGNGVVSDVVAEVVKAHLL